MKLRVSLTIYRDGSQTRSFCYIEDLVEGLIKLMHSPAKITGPLNMGNDGQLTLVELAGKILEITGSKSELAYKPLPEDDPKQRWPNLILTK